MALDLLLTTTAFERDLRRLERQRKDIDKLEDIVNLLQARKPLPPRCIGDAQGRACPTPTWPSVFRIRQSAPA
jgi:hypothetical protein